VSTFYLLPPRPMLGQQFAAFLQGCFPGLNWPGSARAELAELLSTTAQQQAGVYVVFREDVPENVDLGQTMVNDFGATTGDEVVEVSTAGVPRRWQVA
jgi:hypothetical protein